MKYYSLNNVSPNVDFREATIHGQAPDKGLYFPESIPILPAGLLNDIDTLSREEVAFRIIQPYVGGTIPDADLQRIVGETVDFEFPLVPISPSISALELFPRALLPEERAVVDR